MKLVLKGKMHEVLAILKKMAEAEEGRA